MANLGDAHGEWYWCFEHQRVEKFGELDGDDHMGPYPTREAAEHWQDLVDARNKAWDEDEDR